MVDRLLLQPQLYDAALIVTAFGALLVAPSPDGPVQDALGLRWRLPDESIDQPTHFGHGDGQQLAGELSGTLGLYAPFPAGSASWSWRWRTRTTAR